MIATMAQENTDTVPHLLSLPYDIRCLIYSHLFPKEPQIYIAAARNRSGKLTLYPMHARHDLSFGICRASQQLNAEVAGYVYNNYLFNIVGTKKDIMAIYRPISKVMTKYARTKVQIDVLDNGPLSVTACVSIYVSGGRVAQKAARRQRGNPRNFKEVQDEIATMPNRYDGWLSFGNPYLPVLILPRATTVGPWSTVFLATGAAMVGICLKSIVSTR